MLILTSDGEVGVYCLSGPLVGRLVTTHGCRRVCVSGAVLASIGLLTASFAPGLSLMIWCYSVVTGLGFGLMYIPSVVVSAPYFTHKRSLAIGICLCGSGFGTFSLAPVSQVRICFTQSHCIIVWCQYILEHHGWQWVMRLFSLLALVGAGAGLTMLPATPSSPATHESESCDHKTRVHSVDSRGSRVVSWVLGDELASHKKLLCYTVFTLSDFLSFCAIYIPYTHLPPLARSHGVQAGDAAILISVGGMCNTVGRFVGGWISDLPRVQALVVSTLSILVCSVPTTLLASCWSYWTFLVAFGSFGFLTGSVSTISSPFSTIIQAS